MTAHVSAAPFNGGRNNRKLAVGIAAVAASLALITGAGFAFYSDVIDTSGVATAGTLDITGELAVTQTNSAGTVAHADDTVENLNPGDVITFTGPVTNAGNKSAWIRTLIGLDGTDAAIAGDLYVYAGDTVPTQAALEAASLANYADAGARQTALEGLAGFVGTGTDFLAATGATPAGSIGSAADILNGTATPTAGTAGAAETETDAVDTYNPNVTIYFDAMSDNTTQANDVAFTVAVQAIQYRNNQTAPAEKAQGGAWETVVTSEFNGN